MLGYKYPEKYGEPQVLLQDGLELNFVDVGRTGAPGQQTVVMLHGMTQSSSNWGPRDSNLVDPLLKLGFRVICPDNRGHGLSDKPSNEESYIPCADGEDVIKVLDSLGIDKAHLVGHSFGSTVTYKLLVTHPNRILSAVTASQPMGYVAPEEVAALVKGVEGKFLCARTCWYPCCFFGCWYCVAGEFCYPHGPHLLIKSHLLANVNPALDEYKAVSVPVQGIIGDKVSHFFLTIRTLILTLAISNSVTTLCECLGWPEVWHYPHSLSPSPARMSS